MSFNDQETSVLELTNILQIPLHMDSKLAMSNSLPFLILLSSVFLLFFFSPF
jgi:hypothetical protein